MEFFLKALMLKGRGILKQNILDNTSQFKAKERHAERGRSY